MLVERHDFCAAIRTSIGNKFCINHGFYGVMVTCEVGVKICEEL